MAILFTTSATCTTSITCTTGITCTFTTQAVYAVPASGDNPLPALGDRSLTATREEQRLGEAWLRLYRRQVPINSDPLLTEYTEDLLQKIARHNPDAGDTLSLVIVNNPALNAFAVPGGIIGINTGLFQYARTEDQFASVLAHELAHLSQRHYARGVEQQQGRQTLGMAALLASLVIAATSGGDAGVAAIQATQAGIIDSQLRFSRAFEQEADRVGMTTLVKAGFDPHAMAGMFEQMQRATRFSTEPPEFLLTHPITARRIADAANRARNYSRDDYPRDNYSRRTHDQQDTSADPIYHFMRSRVLFYREETPQEAIRRFESELRGFSPSAVGSRYGLVLALTAARQYKRAREMLAPMLERYPDSTALIIAQTSIDAGRKQLERGLARIKTAMERNPGSYALKRHYSHLLTKKRDYTTATAVLNELRQQRPEDPSVWYHLAELAGRSGDILTLHKARAEYFILYGDFDRADNQLDNLIAKFKGNTREVAEAQRRKEDLKVLRKESRW